MEEGEIKKHKIEEICKQGSYYTCGKIKQEALNYNSFLKNKDLIINESETLSWELVQCFMLDVPYLSGSH